MMPPDNSTISPPTPARLPTSISRIQNEVSGMAAALAIRDKSDVQGIDIKELQENITNAGIPLELPETLKEGVDNGA